MQVTLISALILALCLFALWVLSLRLRDVSIIDPAWGVLFIVVAGVAAAAGSSRSSTRWLLLGLTTAWGLRLFVHLTRRKLADPGEDRRYAQMRERHGEHFGLYSALGIFGLQGVLVLVISLPLQVASLRHASVGLAALPGIVVWAIGLAFETVGDAQLTAFRADPASRGQVMNRGLWHYTRHPNYFGDFLVWWGLWLVALSAGGTWWTAVGPLVMSVLLIRVSGKGLLEREIGGRRPGYAEYVRRTSGFIPLPPRRPRPQRGSSR